MTELHAPSEAAMAESIRGRQLADGGAAFPTLPPCGTDGTGAPGYPFPEAGMSLLDYFAAKAMHAFICAPVGDVQVPMFRRVLGNKMRYLLAESSYAVADAMLRARASEREESIGLLQPSAHCRAKFERWQADGTLIDRAYQTAVDQEIEIRALKARLAEMDRVGDQGGGSSP